MYKGQVLSLYNLFLEPASCTSKRTRNGVLEHSSVGQSDSLISCVSQVQVLLFQLMTTSLCLRRNGLVSDRTVTFERNVSDAYEVALARLSFNCVKGE